MECINHNKSKQIPKRNFIQHTQNKLRVWWSFKTFQYSVAKHIPKLKSTNSINQAHHHHQQQQLFTTHTWCRRFFEHCAQRRSPRDLNFSNHSEIIPFHSICCSQNFAKSWFSKKFWNFITMWPTWTYLKLFPQNFPEALRFRIWNYIIKIGAEQKEIQFHGAKSDTKPEKTKNINN